MIHKTAVILCGGKGTRLGSLGKKIPKSLVKIHKYPIIWYIVNALHYHSINHFILPLGYKGHLIKNYLKKNKEFNNLNIDLIDTGLETTISRRIFYIRNKIKSENFVLLNGDAIFDFNLSKILNKHKKNNFDITFLGCSAPLNYGIVGIKNKKIISFERDIEFDLVKSKKKENFSGYTFSGISVIKSKLVKNNFKSYLNFEREFYPKIIKKHKSNFESISGFWHSIDNIKDINILNQNESIKKYRNIQKIQKKLKFNEKKFMEK